MRLQEQVTKATIGLPAYPSSIVPMLTRCRVLSPLKDQHAKRDWSTNGVEQSCRLRTFAQTEPLKLSADSCKWFLYLVAACCIDKDQKSHAHRWHHGRPPLATEFFFFPQTFPRKKHQMHTSGLLFLPWAAVLGSIAVVF